MTVENIFNNFAKKYRDDFNWGIIPDDKKEYFVNELKKESGQEKIILNNKIYAIARNYSDDEVLYILENDSGEKLYRIYHLTYSVRNTDDFPKYTEFPNIFTAGKYIEKKFINEYL